MSYDRNNIKSTTEDGINDLVIDIVGGVVSLEYAFSEIKFKPLQKKISNALEIKDNEDWGKACKENSVESYSDYLSSYNREKPWYIGKHIKEAKNILSKLTKSIDDIDEEAWNTASSEDTIERYQSYLSVYDKSAPDYVGKHVNDAKSALRLKMLREQDDRDWQAALSKDSEEGYSSYLSTYDNAHNDYIGLHVGKAKNALDSLLKAKKEHYEKELSECKFAWEIAHSANTIPSYQDFINRYYSSDRDEVLTLVAQAKNRILSIQDDEDWEFALKTNTKKGYDRYITKYEPLKSEFQGKNLEKAKSWIPRKPNPRSKYIAIISIIALIAACIGIWKLLTREVPLTEDQIQAILTQYVDSLKQDLFDGFYLSPMRVSDAKADERVTRDIPMSSDESNLNSNNGLYSHEDVINQYMMNNGKFVVKNKEGITIDLPEAVNGIDSICVKDSPFFEYIDNNGLRRVVALFHDGLYYYAGECGSHDGFRQYILADANGKYGLVDVNGTVLKDFVNEKIALSTSPEGYFVKNGSTIQHYNYAGNALEPEKTQPQNSTSNTANSVTVERHYGNTKLKDYFKDQSGRIIATFEDISYSSENGFYKVQGTNGKYGIYDSKNKKIALPTIYEDVSVYGSSTNMFPAKKNGKWGYVQDGGNEVIGFNFEEANSFTPQTKLAVVKNDDGKCGYIDMSGKYKIQPQYYSAATMTLDGARVMKSSDEYGYINTTGSLIASWYPYVGTRCALNRIMVGDEDKLRGFVDSQNNLVIPCIFDSKSDYVFDEKTHLCKVSYHGVEWYINTNGAFAYPLEGNPTDQNISQQIQAASEEAERQQKEKEEKANKKRMDKENKRDTHPSQRW